MDYIKENKLRGQRGASLLFAFLFLLVASMVSAVIIAGATTATRRVHDDFGREQNYLTLESAAKLLRDLLKDTTVTVTVVTETDPETGKEKTSPDYQNTGLSPISDMIRDAVKEVYEDTSGQDAEKTIIFIVNVPFEKDKKQLFQDVRMDFTVKKVIDKETTETSYTASGVIKMKDIDANDPYQQQLFFTADFQDISNGLKLDCSKIELHTR